MSAPHPTEEARIAARRETWRKSKRNAAERKAIADELLNRDLMRILETPGPEWRRTVILNICRFGTSGPDTPKPTTTPAKAGNGNG